MTHSLKYKRKACLQSKRKTSTVWTLTSPLRQISSSATSSTTSVHSWFKMSTTTWAWAATLKTRSTQHKMEWTPATWTQSSTRSSSMHRTCSLWCLTRPWMVHRPSATTRFTIQGRTSAPSVSYFSCHLLVKAIKVIRLHCNACIITVSIFVFFRGQPVHVHGQRILQQKQKGPRGQWHRHECNQQPGDR